MRRLLGGLARFSAWIVAWNGLRWGGRSRRGPLTGLVTTVMLWLALGVVSAPAQEMGPTVLIRGSRPDNVYAAGGAVTVDAELARDFVAVGGTITVLGRVREDATLRHS